MRSVLRISGTDRLKFLSDLVTNEIADEGPSYAALLTPQGKLIADFLLFRAEDAIFLDVWDGWPPRLRSGWACTGCARM